MPTYEYTCKECGENFDIVQSFKDKPLAKHPGECGGPVQKVFHASGIVFKGSGFYVTDSRGSKSAAPSSDGAPSTTSTNGSDAKKSDSKKSDSNKSESASPSSKTKSSDSDSSD